MSKKILVLVSHPQIENSRINDALASAAAENPFVTVRHIDEVLAKNGNNFDVDAEHAIVEAHDALVFQFPWFWYAAPATMKKYLDDILTPGWAYRGGNALEGKPVMFAVSTGGPEEAYALDGNNRFTMETLFAPYIATANMTHMVWQDPFVVHGVRTLTDEELAQTVQKYLNRLDHIARDEVAV